MPSAQLRQDILANARKVVVKLGTALLTGQGRKVSAGLDRRYLARLASQIVELRERGFEITIVSSGAIAAGCAVLGLDKRPTDVAELQAMAAVGQRQLMMRFHEAFDPYDLEVAQILLTRSDFEHRIRFLNIRNCIAQLHQRGCIPIVNENDTVAVDEIRFGENDVLSALVCNALRADALILLTVSEGLCDAAGNTIDLVTDIQQAATMVRKEQTAFGSGGFVSKLDAARLVTEAGEIAVIANGRQPNVLTRLFAAESIGTAFVPAARKLDSRQRWIGLTKRPAGTVSIDDGAATALLHRGKSLLAIGITDVTGRFERGEAIMVRDRNGRELARGLTNYSAEEIRLIMGKRSNQFEKILGRAAYAEVVHRDNLVVGLTKHDEA